MRAAHPRARTIRAALRVRTVWLTALLSAVLAVAVGGLGCAFGEINPKDPFKRQYSLSEAQHMYTQLVRWSEFAKASSYVHDDVKERFVTNAPSLRELRFTDYESGPVDIDDETGAATVDVTYYAYLPHNPHEITIKETQYWERDGITNNWKVKPRFDGVAAIEAVGSAP